MNIVIITVIFIIFFNDYLIDEIHLLPQKFNYLIDFISLFTAFYLCLHYAIKRRFNLRSSYFIVAVLFFLNIVIGLAINHSSAKVIILGIRTYFRFIPFFIFPIVVAFDESDIIMHLKFILIFLIIQCPLSIFQRFIQHAEYYTGDVIYGTLMSSSTLSILMICSISILYSFYLRKKISFKFFIATSFILFVPTTINETKITLFILPIALFVPAALDKGFHISTIKNVFVLILAGTAIFTLYLTAYDYTMNKRKNYIPVDELITNQNNMERYFFRKNEPREDGNVGRGSAIFFAIHENIKDLSIFFSGRGIGQVLRSKFKKLSDIEYYQQRGADKLSSTLLLWETGLFGTVLFFSFFFLALKDCFVLLKFNSFFGCLSLAWISVVIIIATLALSYTNFFFKDTIFVLFSYLTGIIASKRYQYSRHHDAFEIQ